MAGLHHARRAAQPGQGQGGRSAVRRASQLGPGELEDAAAGGQALRHPGDAAAAGCQRHPALGARQRRARRGDALQVDAGPARCARRTCTSTRPGRPSTRSPPSPTASTRASTSPKWAAARRRGSPPATSCSATVGFNGTTEDRAAWVAFRFRSDNPGVWPLHCHIAWHEIMGQGLNVISHPWKAIAKLTPPDNLPSCPSTCVWDFANTNPKAAASIYGKTGLLAPESSNLP